MDMTPHEGSSDGGSSAKTDLVLATAVDRFHARKLGTKVEKRGAMKVIITGKVKKQKNNQGKYAGSSGIFRPRGDGGNDELNQVRTGGGDTFYCP
jgi:hypothetical protein